MYRCDIGNAHARVGVAFAQLDADATQFLGGDEAVFVGDVIANEDRGAAGEGLFLHEGAQGGTLADALGARFEHHLARHERKFGVAVDRFLHRLTAQILKLGGLAEVEGDGTILGLDQQFRMRHDQGRDGLSDVLSAGKQL
ncbi:MAG: hypothetical protein K0R85_1952 [Devosia sp.]|nr:hypothetical protein [Devosia sp.]